MVRRLVSGVAMSGARFWGAGARPRGPLLTFTAAPADRSRNLGELQAAASENEIHVVGGMSAGTIGWSLGGEILRHRWTLTLYVTARQQQSRRARAGIEDFDYQAQVRGLTPGRYRLRIIHLYLDFQGQPVGAPLVVLEKPLTVGRSGTPNLLSVIGGLGWLCGTLLGA